MKELDSNMKKLIAVLFILLLIGCEQSMNQMLEDSSSFEVEEVSNVYSEIIVSTRSFGDELYHRLTTSGVVVSDPNEIDWTTASRLIVVYDDTLMTLYPPSFFGINITLEQGNVYNTVIEGMFITLIHPSSRQNLISLANETMDELFVKEGLLVIEDYFVKTGTLVLFDSKTIQRHQLFRARLDLFNTTGINNHFNQHRFATIVFVYQDQVPDALMDMQPTELPRPNHVFEFENDKGQRIIMFHGNELFMEQMINNFIEGWGENYLVERSLFNRDPLLDSQSHLNYQLPPQICRIPSAVQSNVLAGFPLDSLRIPTSGNIRAKVVYLDFLDYRHNPNGPSIEQKFLPLGNNVNRFLEFVSYGKMIYEWDIHPEPLLMPKKAIDYQLNRADARPGYYPTLNIVYEMLDMYRDQVDFTKSEVILVIFNQNIPFHLADVSGAHQAGLNNPFVTNQGNMYNAVTIGSDWSQQKWQVIIHELGHRMGLIDLYDYGPIEDWNDSQRFVGGFDVMGAVNGNNIEFLGWNRYLMNWIDDNQVFCVDPPAESIVVPLQTIGLPVEDEDQLQMIVIPIDRYKVLVIEAKQISPYCLVCDGLLVYTVDTTIANGRGSIKVIPIDRSTHVFKNDAMIRVGETLIAYGFEISLQSASPEGYVVELNKVS
jgi:M6 family metalloprotease-like protein